MEIIVGTKVWSSWSLRPWLALKRTGAPFTETLVQLREVGVSEEIAKYSPSGRVPVLKDGALTIWDSLAICEYLAERFPAAKLWPDDVAARALGRAAAAEMHAGFASLRGECPMDLSLRHEVELSEATHEDIRRIVRLWTDLRGQFGENLHEPLRGGVLLVQAHGSGCDVQELRAAWVRVDYAITGKLSSAVDSEDAHVGSLPD